jgi:hypothetical protein
MESDLDKVEATFGIKPRNWKRELEKRLKAGILPQPGDRSLAALGYPELFRVTLFLTDIGLDAWDQNQSLRFPPTCCVCNEPAAATASLPGTDGGTDIPHCVAHNTGTPRLILSTGSLAPKAVWITLTGQNEAFLLKTLEANATGDAFPPWVVFPDQDSYSGFWKQSGQFWLTQVFRPFWATLPENSKTTYLQKWQAPEDWLEWLNLPT